MIVQNIVEKLMKMFPDAGEQFIIKELDAAQRRFATNTRCLVEVGDLSNITSYISFSLPNDFISLAGVWYYDSDDYPIYEEELTIYPEVHTINDSKKLTFKSTTLTPITALPTTISSIQIEYYKTPDAITTRNSTLEIPEEYWPALERLVRIELMQVYPRKMEVNGRIYDGVDWRGIERLEREVRAYELKAIAERNVGGDDRTYDILIYSHAGQQYKSLRTKVTGTTIAIEGGDVSYSKFVRILVVDDNTYEVKEKTGFGTINVAVDNGAPSITITSPSNEFTDDPATWVDDNQKTPYTYDNAGQISFTPYSTSWGTLEITIWIYEDEES